MGLCKINRHVTYNLSDFKAAQIETLKEVGYNQGVYTVASPAMGHVR